MTDKEFLDGALRGGEADLEKLYEVCRSRTRAGGLDRMHEECSTQADEAAKAWAQVLEEMHPGLKVNLSRVHSPSS